MAARLPLLSPVRHCVQNEGLLQKERPKAFWKLYFPHFSISCRHAYRYDRLPTPLSHPSSRKHRPCLLRRCCNSLYPTLIAKTNPKTLRGLARALSESALQVLYENPWFSSKFSLGQKRREPRTFFSQTPAAREAVPSPTSYDCTLPQQVWASSVLAALCTGVGDVGPKLKTHVPDLDAREHFILLISRPTVA